MHALQIIKQLEQLIYIAYKLNLHPLINRLHSVIRQNTMEVDYILEQRADSILFTPRVLSALSTSSHARRVWCNSMFGESCDLIADDATSSLFVADNPDDSLKPIAFKAVLHRGFMGQEKGTRVDATLDLAEGELVLALEGDEVQSWFNVELRLTQRGANF